MFINTSQISAADVRLLSCMTSLPGIPVNLLMTWGFPPCFIHPCKFLLASSGALLDITSGYGDGLIPSPLMIGNETSIG